VKNAGREEMEDFSVSSRPFWVCLRLTPLAFFRNVIYFMIRIPLSQREKKRMTPGGEAHEPFFQKEADRRSVFI
jgi:hypothetical protein